MEKFKNTIITRLHPLQRMIISLMFSIGAFLLFRYYNLSILIMIMVIWNTFAVSYTTMSWMVLLKRNINQIKQTAVKEDGSVIFVFVMILTACFGSLCTVLLLMITKNFGNDVLCMILSVSGMLVSWLMIHTLFTFHYAHMYYNENTKTSLGLNFPADDKPDYLDFAYFSFVIGCTFQVSDVEITSKQLRRMVLLHGLLSFALNTFVVALTINLIAGARK